MFRRIFFSVFLKVKESSDPEEVHFESSVFGSLGSGVFVGPNTIDFSTVFDDLDQKLKDNAHVLAFIGCLLLCYFITIPIVRRWDIKDKQKV